MNSIGRAVLCLSLLSLGVAAQAGLESMSRIDRPPLRRPLGSLPHRLGSWVGVDQEVDPRIRQESQATELVSRIYENPAFPGARLNLWVNFSMIGDNMRHSPAICFPSQGWTRIESQTETIPVVDADGKELPITGLGYAKEELVQGVGFWYYIFGEGVAERWVRTLPITSRSSHGRTTRGSGLTVEVFWTPDGNGDTTALRDFAHALLVGLEPIMPEDRAEYFVP
ncbi:EpsI family protein [Tundrisphaera sp. TA3]|uniref:EpsI family protein n=1 Tax=Tundrisphaera sp. TA3 TaxID=3435775 RepID=UPI003EC0EB46